MSNYYSHFTRPLPTGEEIAEMELLDTRAAIGAAPTFDPDTGEEYEIEEYEIEEYDRGGDLTVCNGCVNDIETEKAHNATARGTLCENSYALNADAESANN